MKPRFDYKKAKKELDEILLWFELADVDVDAALEKYERAEILLKQIDSYLNDAKAKISLKVNKNDK